VIQVNNREYRLPTRPAVVVCLDGSSREYIDAAVDAGVAPFLKSLLAANRCRMATAAMPTFTNPNNMSIVTGVPPSTHGISGNFFLDRETGRAVMMNDPSFLRAPTILSVGARAGAAVAVVVAKDKLRQLVGSELAGTCISAEQEGVPVYSAALSVHALHRGVELLRTERPDVLYVSTSDFIQHAYAPGTDAANTFYAAVDEQLAILNDCDVNLVVTADHGMNAKSDDDGHPRVVYLQELCDQWMGRDDATVILPITDPYVAHHGSLGSFAWVYTTSEGAARVIMANLAQTAGIEAAWKREEACRRFELPPDRAGDIAVVADRDHVIGTRAADHDLSALHAPLRSHGGCAEQAVPFLFNRPPMLEIPTLLRNCDAFWVALNVL
jgi:phosphonoacetate hydrolase